MVDSGEKLLARAGLLLEEARSSTFPDFQFDTPDGETIRASGVAAQLVCSGPDRFDLAKRWLERVARNARYERGLTPRSLYAVGVFGFDGGTVEEWGTPGSILFIPARVEHIDSAGKRYEVLWQPEETPERADAVPVIAPPRVPDWSRVAWGRDDWWRAVTAVLRRIERGELEKVVLAQSRVLRVARVDAFEAIRRTYPLCTRYRYAPRPGLEFYGASPERLASLREGNVEADAVAGTVQTLDADDPSPAGALLHDAKERSEHAIVVREVRAAVASVCGVAEAEPEPAVERHRHVLHLKSRVTATAPRGLHLLDLAARIHPSPAVAGSPRGLALELIRAWEPRPRGWYAGPIGWMNAAGEGVLTLALRSALVRGQDALLYAGAGIVAGSDPGREWEECEAKLSFLGDLLAHG